MTVQTPNWKTEFGPFLTGRPKYDGLPCPPIQGGKIASFARIPDRSTELPEIKARHAESRD